MNGSLLIFAWVVPVLMLAFLVGRYFRARAPEGWDLSPVTRQHLDLIQGGQLNEAAVEAAKRRFRQWLEDGDTQRVEASLRPGMQYVVRVRALAELGTEEACRILEGQLRRRISPNQADQAWYWFDLAHYLRGLNREESLPLLLECSAQAEECLPFTYFFAAETVSFLGFSSYATDLGSPTGPAALRLLHRAVEGLRAGVPLPVVVEARLGEVVEQVWDQKPAEPHPLLVRLFAEVRRFLRRADARAEEAFADEPFEREAFDLQLSRIQALEAAMEDYLQDAAPALVRRLARAQGVAQRDLLLALDDLRADAAEVLLPLLPTPACQHPDLAVGLLRWSRNPKAAAFLREWTLRTLPIQRRRMKRLRAWSPRRPSIPPRFPYRAILLAMRGHPSPESEQFLLAATHDFDPTYRSAAVGSLGWWEPFARPEVLLHLQDARFDPNLEVRLAARAALARLGERQALLWFKQALSSDNRQRVLEAIEAIPREGLTLLWPDLDKLSETEEPELAYHAREALERLQEDLDQRLGR